MSWLSSFMGTGKKKTTTSGGIDPASQAYVDKMRTQGQGFADQAMAGPNLYAGPTQAFQQGLGALQNMPGYAQQFMNPYEQQVVTGVQGDFDRQRQMAMQGGAQNATMNNAFGGSRQAVLQANLLGDVNRNEASTLAGLRQGGYNQSMNFANQNAGQLMGAGEAERNIQNQQLRSPYEQMQMAQGYSQGGLGPTGYTQSTTQPGQSPFSTLVGLGQLAAGAYGQFGGGGAPGSIPGFPGGAPQPTFGGQGGIPTPGAGAPNWGGPQYPQYPQYGGR